MRSCLQIHTRYLILGIKHIKFSVHSWKSCNFRDMEQYCEISKNSLKMSNLSTLETWKWSRMNGFKTKFKIRCPKIRSLYFEPCLISTIDNTFSYGKNGISLLGQASWSRFRLGGGFLRREWCLFYLSTCCDKYG